MFIKCLITNIFDTGFQAVLRVSGIVWGQRSVFGPFQMPKICESTENLVVICSIRSYKSVKLYENFAKNPPTTLLKRGRLKSLLN